MDSDHLYRVEKKDLPKLELLLNQCFAHDPLYETLIPDPEVRKRLMPELFHCDMDEFYETCEIFADDENLNSVLVVSDEAEPYNLFQFYLSEAKAALQTDTYLIREDPSLQTFRNFLKGEDYLNSSWTDQLHQNQRLHIIYLAVAPNMQHHGIAAHLMNEAIRYATEHRLMISLETHNEDNLEFYQHFGFKVYGIVKRNFPLKQYCLIREVQ
ncbi:MAG: N-acetyltransferase [Lachnospiraceae bacterium]|nr:N-acetyltransferase [Lachnospiraceae bacterium]